MWNFHFQSAGSKPESDSSREKSGFSLLFIFILAFTKADSISVNFIRRPLQAVQNSKYIR